MLMHNIVETMARPIIPTLSEQWGVELKDVPKFRQFNLSEQWESRFLDFPKIRIVGVAGLSDKWDVGIKDVP